MATLGGVQGQMEVDGKRLLIEGDRLIREGRIPVPERAFGSHSDTRPAKLTTGTFESCAPDQCNIDFCLVHPILVRTLAIEVARSIKEGYSLPQFIVGIDDLETRRYNRGQTCLYGSNARVITSRGYAFIRELWRCFFEWTAPQGYDEDWERARETVERMLMKTVAARWGDRAFEMYYTPSSDAYHMGNLSEVIMAFANSQRAIYPNPEELIRITNLEHAIWFMRDVESRAKQLNLI